MTNTADCKRKLGLQFKESKHVSIIKFNFFSLIFHKFHPLNSFVEYRNQVSKNFTFTKERIKSGLN